MSQRRRNPYRTYKLEQGLTYAELALRLGISVDYAKKLGTGACVSVTSSRAKSFERRTRGGLQYDELMDWAAHAPARRRPPRARRSSPSSRRGTRRARNC